MGAQGVPGERHVSAVAGSGRSFSRNQAASALCARDWPAVAFIVLRATRRSGRSERGIAWPNGSRSASRQATSRRLHPREATPASFNVAGLEAGGAAAAPTQASNVPSFMPVIGNKTPPDPMLKARHAGPVRLCGRA